VHGDRTENVKVDVSAADELAEHVIPTLGDPKLYGDDRSRHRQGADRDDLMPAQRGTGRAENASQERHATQHRAPHSAMLVIA
jgi:hypothetical protein